MAKKKKATKKKVGKAAAAKTAQKGKRKPDAKRPAARRRAAPVMDPDAMMAAWPFVWLGYTGFDNVQRKYVGTWMDTFSTGLMNSVGVGTPKDHAIDSAAVAFDPSGKRVSFSCKVRIQDHDHHSYEMWTPGPSGKPYRVMLVEYARKQGLV